MRPAYFCTASLAFLTLVTSSRAQSAARVPLTAAIVSSVLEQNGLPVNEAHIELPAALSSATADPQLYVAAADLIAEGRWRVRLACRKAGECQPFMATIHLPSAPEATARFVALQQSPAIVRSTRPPGNERMVAGQHATMLLESSHMRITLPVLVIDSGTPGTAVRVSSLDRKQTFRAVITDPETVRATLP